MSDALYTSLSWLPDAPADFAARCKKLAGDQTSKGRALRALANFSLNENQLTRLASLLRRLRENGEDLSPLATFRLGLISNATTDFIVPPLVATAARHGLSLECVETPFGLAIQSALDPSSILYQSKLDAVLVAIDYRGLPLAPALGDAKQEEAICEAAMDQIRLIRDAVHANAHVPCIFQTLARPVELSFGSFDLALPGTERSLVDRFNRALASMTGASEDLLLDVAGLAETVGLAQWHDPGLWNLGKIPFSNDFLPLYADVVGRLLGALRGKSRRCLILDLDNTLWGGVIGDDGLEGIALAQGDAQGEAFLTVQRTALALRSRGIVLAVSSKNQDDTARLPFREHAEMLLRENHIAVFQANWNDKATNIKAIAEELSLGLESMVFLDDNPVERGLVREMLPEVAVPELPDDPSLYARTLIASGYFESISFSTEDRQRAEFYQDNAQRLTLQKQAGDIQGYLRSLQMTISFAPFDAVGRSRIAQLINKSNQFNLTTQRYTEAEVADLETNPNAWTLQVRLRDTFGDNGMISVIICKRDADAWEIDTWLMSCRVLMRGVEQAVLNEIARNASEAGIVELRGKYIPSSRNELVKDHYAKLGFTQVPSAGTETTFWRLPLATFVASELPIEVEVDERRLAA
jgi:FkbH-like protein